MVPDTERRFAERPFYEADELDRECESIVEALLLRRRREIRYPISTDDLTVLIKQEGAVLDSSVDLSRLGEDVEGMTEFFANDEPEVSISDQLAPRFRENRRRSTLAHEWGHVHYHGPLWRAKFETRLFEINVPQRIICHRDTILGGTDWMEWQAGYVSGAILMPVRATRKLVSDICQLRGWHADVDVTSSAATELISAVVENFAVSQEAARVRLQKLHLLTDATDQYALFGASGSPS